MERLGLGYEALAEINPRLIYTGLVGYDPRGPYAALPAYDDLIQGAIGLPALARMAGSDEPRYVPLTIADYFVGIPGVTAMLGAVHYRARTGKGQQLTVPMFETMAQLVLAVHLSGRTYEPSIGDPGYLRLLTPQRKPIVDKFHAEAVKALSSPEVKKQLEEQLGMRLVLSTPDEMASFVDGEMAKWSRIIRENDIRLD